MNILKFIPLVLSNLPCLAQTNPAKYVIDDVGITVEKPEHDKQHDEIYNTNNVIYTIGRKFTYSYFYQNTKGEKFSIRKGKEVLQANGQKSLEWDFVNFANQDSITVSRLILQAISGNPFSNFIPDYNQTVIGYEYAMNNGKTFTTEMTGAIENEVNVWIHPPRDNFFRILELNPFPYIKGPCKVGTKWNWKLKIGDHWSDKRWLEWKDGIENSYQYEIIKQKTVSTKIGKMDCYIVHAKATSRIGETGLTAYFNPKFGFIKLEYENIDGTKTILELEKVE